MDVAPEGETVVVRVLDVPEVFTRLWTVVDGLDVLVLLLEPEEVVALLEVALLELLELWVADEVLAGAEVVVDDLDVDVVAVLVGVEVLAEELEDASLLAACVAEALLLVVTPPLVVEEVVVAALDLSRMSRALVTLVATPLELISAVLVMNDFSGCCCS